jgi:MFS family permease
VALTGPLAPLRHRQFRLLWTGMSASLVGDGMLLVALAWQVYTLFGVPSAMSAVGVALSLPQIVTLLFGGVVSDRSDPRRVMLVSDIVRGAVMATLAVLSITGTLTSLWTVIALTAVYGAAAGFFGPAFDALVPQILPDEDLVAANALDQFVRPAGLQILGPALGGAVIAAVGSGWALAGDAGTFLISATCLLVMRRTLSRVPAATAFTTSAEPREEVPSVWVEIREGVSFVRGHVWLWGTFLSATFTYLLFVGPTEVLLPYLVKHEMGGTAGQLGLILASGGLGAVAAALLVGWAGIPRRFITYMYVTWAIATLAVAGYGLAAHTWSLALACVLVNGLEAAGTVAWATTKQRLVPDGMLGRVSSVDWFVSTALLPLSYALAAPVAHVVGVRHTLLGAGLLGAVVTFGFLFLPGMRGPERLDAYTPRHRHGRSTSHSLSAGSAPARVYLERPGALPPGCLPPAGPGSAADNPIASVRTVSDPAVAGPEGSEVEEEVAAA